MFIAVFFSYEYDYDDNNVYLIRGRLNGYNFLLMINMTDVYLKNSFCFQNNHSLRQIVSFIFQFLKNK